MEKIVLDSAIKFGGTVNIPTSIATCAAFTTMSVMYTPEGAKKTCWRYEHEIDAVNTSKKLPVLCPSEQNTGSFYFYIQF